MNKVRILSLFLAALLCLSAAGCGTNRGVPAGELDASSQPLVLESDLNAEPPATEVPSIPEEIESAVPSQSAGLSEPARKEENEAQKPAAGPVDASSAAPAASFLSPDTPALPPVMTPAVFCPPDHPSVYEHTEYTLEGFWAWLNSEEALTEDNGVYKDAVNFYRSCKSFPLASMDTKDLPVRWYKLYSNGELSVSFKWSDDAYNGPSRIAIIPFADKEVPMAKNGAVSYFKAKGNNVASGPATVGNHLTEYPGGAGLNGTRIYVV